MTFTPILLDVATPDLSDIEQQTAAELSQRLLTTRGFHETFDLYYNGEQRVSDLGISTPPQLEALHTVTGWPELIVDVLEERLDVEGFRFPDSTDADDDIWAIWQANDLDEESQLAHLDALIYGRSFATVGSDGPDGMPLITVESPSNMAVRWDARTRQVTAGLQAYTMGGGDAAVLYLPDVTVYLERPEDAGGWKVTNRDEHRQGEAPVVMLANRQRTADRYGRSEITPAVRSITDAGCRTLLGLETAREFYSVPRRYALGASEEDFQKADGSVQSAWDAYISAVWVVERDDEGNVPNVGQFTPMDPAVFTTIIDVYAKLLGAITGYPPAFFGQTTTNPASADAIRSAESRTDKRAERRQRVFGGGWEQVIRKALRISNGDLPDGASRIETIWRSPSTPTPAATTDAITKQVQTGVLPAESDVTLERLGYSPVERRRIRADRKTAQGRDALTTIAEQVRQRGVTGG